MQCHKRDRLNPFYLRFVKINNDHEREKMSLLSIILEFQQKPKRLIYSINHKEDQSR